MRPRREGGFTLIEVMIALAILAGGLVFLMRSTASNIFAAQKAQMLTAASNLARGKMYEIEERLLADGYQELDQVEEGNFGDDGIELPDMATLQNVAGQGQEGQGAAGGTAPGGLLGGILGTGGMAGSPSNAMGATLMGGYYSLVSDILKDAIRKVTLTVSYPLVGGETQSFAVTCYFTDPKAVNRKVPFAGGTDDEEQQGGGNNQQGGGNNQQGGGNQQGTPR